MNVSLLGLTDVTPSNKESIELNNTSAVSIALVIGNPALNSLKFGDVQYGTNIAVVFVLPGQKKKAATPPKLRGSLAGIDTQKIYACPIGVGSATVDITEFVDTRTSKFYD